VKYRFDPNIVALHMEDVRLQQQIKSDPEGVHLAAADPFSPLPCQPKHVLDAVKDALDRGMTHYPPVLGVFELRQAIAETVTRLNGLEATADDVLVCPGSTPALSAAIRVFLAPGDEVLNPCPSFPVNFGVPQICGARSVKVPLYEEDGFQVREDEIEKRVTSRTKVLVLTNPNNPTSTVYTRETLEGVARVAIKHDLVVVADENFQRLVYDGRKHISIATLPGMHDRTVTIFAFSKDMGMTGFRVGAAIAHPEIVDMMSRLQRNTASSANTFSQYGAVAALQNPSVLEEWRACYLRGRDIVMQTLGSVPGVRCRRPESAYYAWVNVSQFGASDQVADHIMTKVRVAVNPGTVYGEYGEGYIRASFGYHESVVKEGFSRIARALLEYPRRNVGGS
jgi:aspartate/methionine/tyrosine aminotransferase